MPQVETSPVVAAVDHDYSGAGLAYAVQEARRRGVAVHLVHVVHLGPRGPQSILIDEPDLHRLGSETLHAAQEWAEDEAGDDVLVTTDLLRGPVVPSLVTAASGAPTIVLERRSLSRGRRILTRSVTGGVAARTRVPVVSVPTAWRDRRGAAPAPTVTVGVDDPEQSGHVLRAALDAASLRAASLRIVHAWWYPTTYEGVVISLGLKDEWARRSRAEIEAVVDALRGPDASVAVSVESVQGLGADALLAASADADLLVVGRHDPALPIGSHLGSVARAVLNEARCPVLLADPEPRR